MDPSLANPVHTPACSARQRLLDAGAVVFARDGLAAATTREIARVAGVNEVTIFRLFHNKQNLMTAVLEHVFAPSLAEGLNSQEAVTDLAEIVREHAASYAASLERNPMLIRVLIGEIQHFQEHEISVIKGVFRPKRQRLIDRLRAAQQAGLARQDFDPSEAADQINSVILMGVLRNTLPLPPEPGTENFVEGCVQTFVRALEKRNES